MMKSKMATNSDVRRKQKPKQLCTKTIFIMIWFESRSANKEKTLEHPKNATEGLNVQPWTVSDWTDIISSNIAWIETFVNKSEFIYGISFFLYNNKIDDIVSEVTQSCYINRHGLDMLLFSMNTSFVCILENISVSLYLEIYCKTVRFERQIFVGVVDCVHFFYSLNKMFSILLPNNNKITMTMEKGTYDIIMVTIWYIPWLFQYLWHYLTS